jgi:metal-responsive CopG/Arc/MetJ family transcriptional regulator
MWSIMRIIYTAKIQMKRLNITLPDDIVTELDSIPNKSRYIAAALKEKMEKEKTGRPALRRVSGDQRRGRSPR